jgi:hypothetical protein
MQDTQPPAPLIEPDGQLHHGDVALGESFGIADDVLDRHDVTAILGKE